MNQPISLFRRRPHNLGDLQRRGLRHAQRRTRPQPPLRALIKTLIWGVSAVPPRYGLHLLILLIASSSLLLSRNFQQSPLSKTHNDTSALAIRRDAAGEQRPFLGVGNLSRQAGVASIDTPLIPASDSLFAARTWGLRRLGGVFQPFSATLVNSANLRTGPGTAFDRISVLAQSESVTVLARADNWLHIQTANGERAWIAADLVDLSAEVLENLPIAKSIPTSPAPLIAQVNTIQLNLRDGPGTEYVAITQLAVGTQLDLLAKTGAWLKVQTANGTSGWVYRPYLNVQAGVLERVAETEDIPPIDPALLAAAAERGINLRTGPGTAYASLGTLEPGASLALLARYETWYKVQTASGANGWVASDLLTVSDFIRRRVPTTSDIPALPKPAVAEVPAPAPAPEPPPPPAPEPTASWVWPTVGNLTSAFGWRDLGGTGNFHNGIDIANQQGTIIVAIRSGTVIQAGWCSGYGYCVILDHGDGFTSEYGHMMATPPVVNGQAVYAGQLIGYMGTTYDVAGGGYSTGVHLHLTVRQYGTAVNPLAYLP